MFELNFLHTLCARVRGLKSPAWRDKQSLNLLMILNLKVGLQLSMISHPVLYYVTARVKVIRISDVFLNSVMKGS